jgi:hypothetical protein
MFLQYLAIFFDPENHYWYKIQKEGKVYSERDLFVQKFLVIINWRINQCRIEFTFIQDTLQTSNTSYYFWHSEDLASWYILIIKAKEIHYFSNLFDKVLYMFRRSPMSIIRSISTLYTRNSYLSSSSVGVC